jgi:hypothetical protein
VTLVKPLVHERLRPGAQGPQRGTPLGDPLVVADDFSCRSAGAPRGRPRAATTPGLDHRRLGTEKFSGSGWDWRTDRTAVDHVLSTFVPEERLRLDELLDAAADAVEAWARDGTNKAANRFNAFLLRPADTERLAPPGEVDGPPGPDGIRRTKTGWRRLRPGKDDA